MAGWSPPISLEAPRPGNSGVWTSLAELPERDAGQATPGMLATGPGGAGMVLECLAMFKDARQLITQVTKYIDFIDIGGGWGSTYEKLPRPSPQINPINALILFEAQVRCNY
jgi:hypothetical protein